MCGEIIVLAAAALSFLAVGCASVRASTRNPATQGSPDLFLAPSMAELLVHAPDYEGERIHIVGFYGGIVTGLFLTRDHADVLDFDSAFIVADPTGEGMREHCFGHYVRVEGTFGRIPGGPNTSPHPSNFAITNVTKITTSVARVSRNVAGLREGRGRGVDS